MSLCLRSLDLNCSIVYGHNFVSLPEEIAEIVTIVYEAENAQCAKYNFQDKMLIFVDCDGPKEGEEGTTVFCLQNDFSVENLDFNLEEEYPELVEKYNLNDIPGKCFISCKIII